MLLHTFQHIQGIGPKSERNLWAAGCRQWQDLIEQRFDRSLCSISASIQDYAQEQVSVDWQLFQQNDLKSLAERFKQTDHWRFYQHFAKRTVYLDIETTGTDPRSSLVTVIGIYSEQAGAQVFIDGINLDSFPAAIQDFDIIVTFNGGSFDLPFLRRNFPDLQLPPAHIDCRWLARSCDLTGGLKKIERELGIERNPEVANMSGAEAVTLWQRYLRQADQSALHALVRYNLEDTINLQCLLHICLNRIYNRHPFLDLE